MFELKFKERYVEAVKQQDIQAIVIEGDRVKFGNRTVNICAKSKSIKGSRAFYIGKIAYILDRKYRGEKPELRPYRVGSEVIGTLDSNNEFVIKYINYNGFTPSEELPS